MEQLFFSIGETRAAALRIDARKTPRDKMDVCMDDAKRN